MSVEIGFTDDSLKRSNDAKCAPLLRVPKAVYLPVPEDGPDPYGEYRDQGRYLSIEAIKKRDPELYGQLAAYDPFMVLGTRLAWHDEARAKVRDRLLMDRLDEYVRVEPNAFVEVSKLPDELRNSILASTDDRDIFTAWDAVPTKQQRESYCSSCPIRPPDAATCYVSFSDLPGMRLFREGFLGTLNYMRGIAAHPSAGERLQQDEDRADVREQLRKVNELSEQLTGAPLEPAPPLANLPASLTALPELTPDSEPYPAMRGFVDDFTQEFIYRTPRYSPDDARRLLLYAEALTDLAGRAAEGELGGADDISFFRERMDRLVTMLRIAGQYQLDTFMSW